MVYFKYTLTDAIFENTTWEANIIPVVEVRDVVHQGVTINCRLDCI